MALGRAPLPFGAASTPCQRQVDSGRSKGPSGKGGVCARSRRSHAFRQAEQVTASPRIASNV